MFSFCVVICRWSAWGRRRFSSRNTESSLSFDYLFCLKFGISLSALLTCPKFLEIRSSALRFTVVVLIRVWQIALAENH